jgi:hypothetical protein
MPTDDAAEPPPLEVDDAFALGEPSGHLLTPVAVPAHGPPKSSALLLAIVLHAVAVIVVVAVLYWKFAQVAP